MSLNSQRSAWTTFTLIVQLLLVFLALNLRSEEQLSSNSERQFNTSEPLTRYVAGLSLHQ